MSFVVLGLRYLARRWAQAAFAILIGALGTMAIVVAVIAADALPRAAERAWGGVDIVVGPKGSSLDLVLCCVLHLAEPRALVPARTALAAVSGPTIRAAAPVALGDNVGGWRIVGTTPALIDVYGATLAQGQIWKERSQALVGAAAARALNLKVGDTFVGAHGFAAGGEQHEEYPYTVVGILRPTGSALDRLVLTDMDTVRFIHAQHEKEEASHQGAAPGDDDAEDRATAVVASLRSKAALLFLPRQIEASPLLSAASPTLEIARLASYARPVIMALSAVGILLAVIAAACAAIALMSLMSGRARDLALLRALGASRIDLAIVTLTEAGTITAGALLAGAGLTAAIVYFSISWIETWTGLLLRPTIHFDDVALVVGSAGILGLLAAVLPTVRAARADIEELIQS